MANYYNLDGIITELKKRNAEDRAKLEAWEKVTFPTKKDGKPFARMAQNISGAKYAAEAYTLQPGEMAVTVSALGAEYGVGCVSDSIHAYTTADRLTDAQKAKPANLLPRVSCLKQIYIFDLDDIKSAVAARCEQLRKRIADREKQLSASAVVFESFRERFGAALAELDKLGGSNTELCRMVRDTVIARYPYC